MNFSHSENESDVDNDNAFKHNYLTKTTKM